MLLAASQWGLSQAPQDAPTRLQQALKATSLDASGARPWHLQFTFTLKGSPIAGTLDEWWDAGRYRITVKNDTYSATEVSNEAGFYRTPQAERLPYGLNLLRLGIIHPMPQSFELEGARAEMNKQNYSKTPMDCLTVLPPETPAKRPISARFPTYCFNEGTDFLRIVFRNAAENLYLNQMANFGEQKLGLDLFITLGSNRVGTAHVVKMERVTADAGTLSDTTGLLKVEPEPLLLTYNQLGGKLITRTDPIYPPRAKQFGLSGVVSFLAIIGKDGHVRTAQTIDSPDPNLERAAKEAVLTWVYKPFISAGEPVEAETIITVNFTFGGNMP